MDQVEEDRTPRPWSHLEKRGVMGLLRIVFFFSLGAFHRGASMFFFNENHYYHF